MIAVSKTHVYSIKEHIVMFIIYTRHLTWKNFQLADHVKKKHHIYTQVGKHEQQKQL